jgi:hypothetical protein
MMINQQLESQKLGLHGWQETVLKNNLLESLDHYNLLEFNHEGLETEPETKEKLKAKNLMLERARCYFMWFECLSFVQSCLTIERI